jgi:uncharacterized membrane protein
MSDRNLKIGLIVSIILNVFLIGGIVGGLAFWRLNPQVQAAAAPAAGPQPRRALRFAADELGPQQQRVFRQALRQARTDALPSLREGQAHRRDLVGLIGADDFDRSAVMNALSGARTADAAVRARLETAVVDYAAGLSPADRAVFVRGLARSPTLRQPPVRQNPQGQATGNPAPVR